MTDETAEFVRNILWYALADPEEAIEFMIELLYEHNVGKNRE